MDLRSDKEEREVISSTGGRYARRQRAPGDSDLRECGALRPAPREIYLIGGGHPQKEHF
jgi:hypothetical protein